MRFLATGNFMTNLLHIHSGEGGNTANSPYSKSRIFSLKWGVMFFCAVEDRTKKTLPPTLLRRYDSYFTANSPYSRPLLNGYAAN